MNEYIDVVSIKLFLITVLSGMFTAISSAQIVVWITIAAGATSICYNIIKISKELKLQRLVDKLKRKRKRK